MLSQTEYTFTKVYQPPRGATPIAPLPGFEPGTLELTALCSAVELKGKVIQLYQTGDYFTSPETLFFISLNLV